MDVQHREHVQTFTTLKTVGRQIVVDNSENMNIYPNPTTGIVNITLPNNTQMTQLNMINADNTYTLTIYNITGKVIYIENELIGNTVKQIDMSEYSKGVYLVNIRNERYNRTVKLILQ